MESGESEPTYTTTQLVGFVTNNTHFVETNTGAHFAIESVIGYDKAGGEQTYYAWLFPEGHPARAYVNTKTVKVQID